MTVASSLGSRYNSRHLLFYGKLGDMGGHGNRLRAHIRLSMEQDNSLLRTNKINANTQLSLFQNTNKAPMTCVHTDNFVHAKPLLTLPAAQADSLKASTSSKCSGMSSPRASEEVVMPAHVGSESGQPRTRAGHFRTDRPQIHPAVGYLIEHP